MANLKEKSLSLLTSKTVDFNNTSKGTIYTVPAGKSCVVHSIILRNATADVHLNANSFGFNSDANDVIDNAAYSNLTDSSVYIPVMAKNGSKIGLSGEVFGLKCNSTNTPGNVTIDVFGYLY